MTQMPHETQGQFAALVAPLRVDTPILERAFHAIIQYRDGYSPLRRSRA
jgi:hypothetical protein